MSRENLQPLSTGTSTFSELRRFGQIYVDKTDLACRMASTDGKFFLARPRLFGKSLLVSTFESLFRDGLQFFGGLAAERLWHDRTYPVVHLCLSAISSTYATPEEFGRSFAWACCSGFEKAGFRYSPESSSGIVEQLSCWMEGLQRSSIVLLIDGYDTPLTVTEGTVRFGKSPAILTDFYRMLKANEGCLRFLFTTGITKFRDAGIFTAFSGLEDISMSQEYGSLLGFTEAELSDSYGCWLDAAAPKAGFAGRDELVSAMREMYCGYCFDRNASVRVFQPWSVLRFLDAPEGGLHGYWYVTGGRPKLLMERLALRGMDGPEGYWAAKDVAVSELEAPRTPAP